MKSYHGTGDIIQRPFTAYTISQRLAHCDKIYDAFLEGIAAEFGGDVDSLLVSTVCLFKWFVSQPTR
jgi:hypothetical protein